MKKNKIKKILFSLVVFLQIFSLVAGNFYVAMATDVTDVAIGKDETEEATKDAFDKILEMLGIKSENAEDGGSSANVADHKGGILVPTVSIMFSPTDAKVGEKVTAIAIAKSFANDKEKLYYTWFLKRKGCDIKPTEYEHGRNYGSSYLSTALVDGDARTKKECDVDDDGLVTVNDWKVDAGRTIVQNGFIPDIGAKYETRDDFYASETDDDGYVAWQGGADAERIPAHCYSYHPTEGLNYELIKNNKKSATELIPCGCTAEQFAAGGCGGMALPACGIDIAYEVSPAEYHFCGCFGEQNHVPDVAIKYCMGCDDAGWAADDPGCFQGTVKCHKDTTVISGSIPGLEYHADCDDFDPPSTTQYACEEASTPSCVDVGGTNQAQCPSGEKLVCPLYAPTRFDDPSGYFFGQNGATYGGSSAVTANQPVCGCSAFQNVNNANDANQCTDGEDISSYILCAGADSIGNTDDQFHLFPWSSVERGNDNYYEQTRDYAYSDREEYDYRMKTDIGGGDNKFESADEKFWGTDPRNPSTAGNGKADESNLAGRGIDQFSWTYEEGDEVGVAIEGTSTNPTKFADSSRMIFWAFSQGVASVTDEDKADEAACQPRIAGTYEASKSDTDTPSGSDAVSMNAAFLDFDRCIAASTIPLVAGGGLDGSQPKAMEVELSATPDNPLNDETGEGKGDTVNVQAVVTGATGSDSDLTYDWKIQAFKPTSTKAPTERDWTANATLVCSKTDPANGCPLLNEKDNKLKLTGLGLKGINFKLNLEPTDTIYSNLFNTTTGEGYLKVSVEVRESATDSTELNSRVGRGDTVVKVISSQNQINVFLPEVSGTKLAKTGSPNLICDLDADEKSVCPVIKNQIIGLSTPDTAKTGGKETFTDFSWFLNGKAINNCDADLSADCANDKSTDVVYVPITDSGNETFTVSVKASNTAGTGTGTGKKVELSRKFKVVEPSIKIAPDGDPVSGSGAWKKLLGTIVDPTGLTEDKEDSSESILETATGNEVTLLLDYTPAYISDEISSESWQMDGVSTEDPQFTAGAIGTVHNASASVVYTQSAETYNILSEKFGISVSEMKDKTLSHSVQIEVNKEAGAVSLKKTTRFLANLFSKIPEQILFFIRLILSMGMMLVLVGAIFSFFPEVSYDEKRRR